MVDDKEVMEELMEPANPNNVSIARRTLVGKFIANKAVNKPAAKEVIANAWSGYDKLQISDLGLNMLLFTFESEEHSKEVMRKTPWFFLNRLMCVQYWIPEVAPYEIYFDHTPFWIQIHNLPMEFLNGSNATTILSKVGTVLEVEEPIIEGRILRTYVRAKVAIDITQPLPSGCWIPRKDLPRIWASYKYERLQDLCVNCGVIGHEPRVCKTPRKMSAYCSTEPKYDHRTSTTAPKPLDLILKEHIKRYETTSFNPTKKVFKSNGQEGGASKQNMHNVTTAKDAFFKAQEEEREQRQEMSHKAGEEEDMYRQIWKDIKLASNIQHQIPILNLSRQQWLDNLERSFDRLRQGRLNDKIDAPRRGPGIRIVEGKDKQSGPENSDQGKKLAVEGFSDLMLEGPLSTMIPLGSSIVCPGLGPKNIADLGLFKEDVGLKEPIISKDYPSPTNEEVRYGGAHILPSQAKTMKEQVSRKVWKTKEGKEKGKGKLNDVTVTWREPPKLLQQSPPAYVVEFPPEDASPVDDGSKILVEEEQALSLGMSTELSLQKKRKMEITKVSNSDTIITQKKFKTEFYSASENGALGHFGQFSVGHYTKKKEAAGKLLPPPSQ